MTHFGPIESNIPVPPRKSSRKPSPLTRTLMDLKVGDSMFVEMDPATLRRTISSKNSWLKNNRPHFKFAIRKETSRNVGAFAKDGSRIWRLE